jgi:hypothetical protein
MSGSVLIVPGMAGMIASQDSPQPDIAVAANFERFDGFEALDHPGTADGGQPVELVNYSPRPGQQPTPLAEQTYTPSTLSRTVSTLGGQPLPVGDRVHRAPGDYTPAKAPTVQWRLGVGQNGPAALGAQQTVQLSEITNQPPEPGDITGIIAGIA